MTSGQARTTANDEADPTPLISLPMTPLNPNSSDVARSDPISIPARTKSEPEVLLAARQLLAASKSSSAPETRSPPTTLQTSSTHIFDHTSSSIPHVIHLSSIEHCMPRAYIRVCLAYRLPHPHCLDATILKLNGFVRRTVDAKPYLSGYVVPSPQNSFRQIGHVEICFTNEDFLNFPAVDVKHFTPQELPHSYDELHSMHLPPSIIRPDLVSALPEGADHEKAPVFRVQANVVPGGLIVSFYLHHCISDGTGLGLLVTGSVLNDDFAFDRHMDPSALVNQGLSQRLEAFANQMSVARTRLSWSSPNQTNKRHIDYKIIGHETNGNIIPKPPGRGCVFALSKKKLADLKTAVCEHIRNGYISRLDVVQTLLWHHMTRARTPSLEAFPTVTTSKLLVPVNIRDRLKEPLSESYFGSAIDFATVQLDLHHLSLTDPQAFAQTACRIRAAIGEVDEAYVRQTIALARMPYAEIDVRDLLASNMDRTTGADMYITSWEKLRLYEATLDLDLGRPDWVRKPWSKDPGSCIILPDDDRKPYTEVVVQMTEADMDRLLQDEELQQYIVRIIE